MNILMLVKPTNLLSEKEKFFADTSYNPQFTYKEPITPEKMTQWGRPNQAVYEYALGMLKRFPVPAVPEQRDIVTEEIVRKGIASFNERYALPQPLEVFFETNLVSRCKVTPGAIYFQLPLVYTPEQFADLLRHELETHVLRYRNHALQDWRSHESPELLIRRTEEGLANLHTHLLREDKHLYKSFFSYVATYAAEKHSFSEVFHTLVQLGRSEQTSWNTAVKVKRGMTDTSQPGVFSREICYLEGIVKLWKWVLDPAHDLTALYWGRIALEELPDFPNTVLPETLRVPTFITESDSYRTLTTEIGIVNHFEELQGIL